MLNMPFKPGECVNVRQCKKVNVKICEFGDVAYFRSITASLAESLPLAVSL